MVPDNGNLPVQNDHEDDDDGTVEIVVKGQFPVVHLDARQIVMKTDCVEGANQTRTHAKQSAPKREINLSVDSSNVPNYHGNTGEDSLPSRFLSVYQITVVLSPPSKSLLNQRNHRDAKRPRYLIEGHFDVLQTQVAHCNGHAKHDREREHFPDCLHGHATLNTHEFRYFMSGKLLIHFLFAFNLENTQIKVVDAKNSRKVVK